MISLNTHQSISQNGLEGGGMLAGLDLMTSIQILLVQDYDNQLKHLGKQMKVANQVKKSYRKEIEKFQQMQTRQTFEFDKQKDWVKIEAGEESFLDREVTFIGDEFAENAEDMVKIQIETSPLDSRHEHDGRYVRKESLEKKISLLDTKLDSVNEQSELMGLKLQSLTNQRKTAFESVSNLFRKEAETLNTVVSNIRG